MVFTEENKMIRAFAPKSSDQTFTMCICLGNAVRSADDLDTQVFIKNSLEMKSIFIIPVAEKVLGRRVVPGSLQDLLVSPIGSGMFGSTPVKDSAGLDVKDDKHINLFEGCRGDRKEICSPKMG